jgi:hypothetical protein
MTYMKNFNGEAGIDTVALSDSENIEIAVEIVQIIPVQSYKYFQFVRYANLCLWG